jgi:hypothetical protein
MVFRLATKGRLSQPTLVFASGKKCVAVVFLDSGCSAIVYFFNTLVKHIKQLLSLTTSQQGRWLYAALETRRFCGRPEIIALKPPAMDAGGNNLFLARSRMIEIWRVEGGLTAPRVGVGEFALIPQKKYNFVEIAYLKL